MNLGSHDNISFTEASADEPFPWAPPFAAVTTAPGPNVSEGLSKSQGWLKSLIEGGVRDTEGGWTYAIFWEHSYQFDDSAGSSLISWADGYLGLENEPRYSASPEEQYRRKNVVSELSALIGGSDEGADEDVTDIEWFFLVSIPQSFGTDGGGFSLGQAFLSCAEQELSGMMGRRAGEGEVQGLQTVVFIPLVDGVLELASTQLTFQNSVNKVMGLLNQIWSPSLPYMGYTVHRRQLIRRSLNAERLPKRAQNERENHGHKQNSLKWRLAGKEKISEQILECPWPLLSESSDGGSDRTSYSDSDSNGFSGPS